MSAPAPAAANTSATREMRSELWKENLRGVFFSDSPYSRAVDEYIAEIEAEEHQSLPEAAPLLGERSAKEV